MKAVTHSGSFHADDVFAAATLKLAFPESEIEFVRTREKETIASADVVFDVGAEYDPERKRFDHHQKGGAGERENDIPYAAFGLVWKHYGEQAAGGRETARRIDEKLVRPVDAGDNGIALSEPKFPDLYPYEIHNVVASYRPTWKEDGEVLDRRFEEAVAFAEALLTREIKRAQDRVEGEAKAREAYDAAEDKRLIILDDNYPWHEIYSELSEPLFVVIPASDRSGDWHAYGVRRDPNGFELRKDLPEDWAGKADEELAEITGVPDAVFCHNKRFIAVASSKHGAIELARKALSA